MNRLAITAQCAIKIVDTDSNEIVQTFNTGGPIYYICFNNNGNLLAVASRKGFITIFEVGTGEARIIPTQRDALLFVAFSKSDEYLLCRFHGGEINIWSLVLEQVTHTFSCPSATAAVPFVWYSKDESKLIANHIHEKEATKAYGLTVFDLSTSVECFSLSDDALVRSIALCPTHDHMATGSNDGFVKVYNTDDYGLLLTSYRTGFVAHVLYFPDGTKLASAIGSYVVIFDSITLVELLMFTLPPLSHSICLSISINARGTQIAASSSETVKLFDAETGIEVPSFDVSNGRCVCFVPLAAVILM